MKSKTYFFYLMLCCCFAQVSAQICNDAVDMGEGTFYGGVAGGTFGNCSLPVATGDFLHCALNNFDYDGSNACGACIKVTGPKGSVTLKVVDRCPECADGDVDMTQEAFEMIAEVIDGRVPISWRFVPCETDTGNESIKINFKEGSSAFWTAIQFRDITHAISKMEYQKPDNTWTSVNRELFNFFIETAGIPSPMDLRVTSVLDEVLVFEDINLNLNEDFDTGRQFSTPQECDEALSIPEFRDSAIVLHPNPTSGILHIKNNSENWVLRDSSGKIVDQGSDNIIDISTFASGFYFITYNTGKTLKIIKH